LGGEIVAQYGTLVQLLSVMGVPSEIDWMRRICGSPAWVGVPDSQSAAGAIYLKYQEVFPQ
jgi:hypothetical protein